MNHYDTSTKIRVACSLVFLYLRINITNMKIIILFTLFFLLNIFCSKIKFLYSMEKIFQAGKYMAQKNGL